jgi:hypothetical protein
MKRSEGCELCGEKHEKWWDCPHLVKKKHFNYSFTVQGGTPKGPGRQK